MICEAAITARAVAAPPAAAETPDPIFAVIEAHREALKAWDAAGDAVTPLEEEWFAQRKSAFDFDAPKGSALDDAEERAEVLDDLEKSAADALVETTPTTLAGALAAIRYVIGYFDGKSELYPGKAHEVLDDDQCLIFIETIGDAVEAAIAAQKAAAQS
jgi:hypothetical protein